MSRATYVVPTIFPAFGDGMYIGPRGQAGIRVDSKGNIYTVLSANAPAATPELRERMAKEFPGLPQSKWGAYATPEIAARRVQFFPKRDEVWDYSVGMAYKLEGFKGGKLLGESRASGTVALDKVYETETTVAQAAPLQIVPLTGNILRDANAWQDAPASTLRREGAPLATAQLGYDAQNL